MKKFQAFIFESFEFFPEEKKLTLRYSFDSEIFFEENIFFDFEFIDKNYDQASLKESFFGLWVMSGISYFKIFCPPTMKFKNHFISPEQKTFFEKIYQHGLGEFFYQNNLDLNKSINFKSEKCFKKTSSPVISIGKVRDDSGEDGLKKVLVPLGGGKDSLTTIHLLQKNDFDFETITVDSDERFEKVSALIQKPHIEVRRVLDPKIFQINKHKKYLNNTVYNGHIPISSIWSFIFLSVAIFRNNKYIALSNEHSASESTTLYRGVPINHQYSKSLEYEQDFQAYVKKFVTSEIKYFSLLRPLSELKIAEIFCQNVFEKFQGNFSSCNKNFKVQKETQKKFEWCNSCPKCAFVFLIFSPFLERERLIQFFGENLFLKKSLIPEYEALLGLRESKPFECVGEIDEVRLAFSLVENKFSEVKVFLEKLKENNSKEEKNKIKQNNLQRNKAMNFYDYEKIREHCLPKKFFEIFRIEK